MVALEQEIKRLRAKPPDKQDTERIKAKEEQRKGIVNHKGWWDEDHLELKEALRNSLTEPQADHVAPSCKDVCAIMCGCCPCCIDDHELKEAKEKLADLEKGQADPKELSEAKDAVDAAEKALEKERQTKISASVGCFQTAVAMPCMIGL